MLKDFPELNGIDEGQINNLRELFYRSDGELTDRLRQTITQSIDGLSSYKLTGNTPPVDMFSVEGFEQTLNELMKAKGQKSLKSHVVSFAVPRLYFRMLQEISAHPALSNVFAQILECQKARFRQDVIEQLSEIQNYTELDDKAILSAVNAARQRLKAQAKRGYDIKMAGREPNVNDYFHYIPPVMRRVIKEDNQIPDDFENHTELIDTKAFHKLFLEKKRVLIIAGAGVGKTTFLYRMQLDLMLNQIKETPLPVLTKVNDFFKNSGTLKDRTVDLLSKTKAVDFSPDKAQRIAGILNENGRLCFLLDSLDQCRDDRSCRDHFQMDSSGILEQNRVAVSSRIEHIKSAPDVFRDIFHSYEWIILDGFGKPQLLRYLGDEIAEWLNYDNLPESFQELLTIPFYANIARRIGLLPNTEKRRVETRSQLLAIFMENLFIEARSRGISINPLDESKINNLLYQLSLDTLTEGHFQVFPFYFLDRYEDGYHDICKIIFDAHWVFFNKTLFEGKDQEYCTFYHLLLQEYFASCRLKQLFEKDLEAFDNALTKLFFNPIVLDLLDDLLYDEPVFDHCMEQFEAALTQADLDKKGIEGAGHKFTWLLALRDWKAEKPKLKERLREIFDVEKERSLKEAETDGKFVKIPAGAFLMGSYITRTEMPVLVEYVPDFWISMYAETFNEFDEYCLACDKEKPGDSSGGIGERPVINVSWDDAQAYLSWLGNAYSLPTEAQWEKAARGRLGRMYPWGNDEPTERIYYHDLNHMRKNADVKKYEPQMYGICHILRSYVEWVNDYYVSYYEFPDSDWSSFKAEFGMLRGGGWGAQGRICRLAFRNLLPKSFRHRDFGFRLSKSATLGP